MRWIDHERVWSVGGYCMLNLAMADALVEREEAELTPFAEIRDPDYPEYYAPYFEQPPCMP